MGWEGPKLNSNILLLGAAVGDGDSLTFFRFGVGCELVANFTKLVFVLLCVLSVGCEKLKAGVLVGLRSGNLFSISSIL